MSRKNETDGSLLRVDAGSESLTAGWHRRKRRRKRRAEYEEGALRVKGRFINEVRRVRGSLLQTIASMEGEAEESDEGEEKPTVIWEKCIQQSIFVDLSEDESLHLSDLENSLALHLSQAESGASETSIHFSGSEELSALDVTSSDSSSVSSQSEREGDTEDSMMPVSDRKTNTIQDKSPLDQRYEDPGQNTSDEDQEDLPYDGELGSSYFNQTATSESTVSSDGGETVQGSPEAAGVYECNARNKDDVENFGSVGGPPENPAASSSDDAHTKNGRTPSASKARDGASLRWCPADINQVLLRHFSQEELLLSGRLLEAETLPEVSLLESVDDTVQSLALTHNSASMNPHHPGRLASKSDSFCSLRTAGKGNKVSNSLDTERKTEDVTFATPDNTTSNSEDSRSSSTSSVVVVEQEKAGEDDQVQRVPLMRARSFSEMKYGQGQVHYPLPDFSKVAPKVKIPKVPSGPARPAPQCASIMHRTQSSPGMLEVISRILEDSVWPLEKPYVFKDEARTPPELAHHLQDGYNSLLTKYAAAENLIDEMRIGANPQPSTELMSSSVCNDDGQRNMPEVEEGHPGPVAPPLALSETATLSTDSSCQPEGGPSDGERMTAALRGIVNQFSERVEGFRLSVSQMSISTAEQQMMLRSIMEAQDQLERNYITRKEEHRALEMQNYMGLSRNTGTFDPNRLVEGDIFRIGMNLEDIKEMIDRNVCEQIFPPHSSSTPTSMKESLHVKPVCMSTPPPPPSPQKAPSADFSTVGYITETQKTEEQKDDRDVYGDDKLQQSCELMTADSSPEGGRHTSLISRSSHSSLQALDIHGAEDDEERSSILSEAIDHSDILAYLNGRSSSCRRRQQTPKSSVQSAGGECNLGDCASLAVQVSISSDAPRDAATHSFSEPPLNTSSAAQRIVSPETDSGFGSSYLNQSVSGSLQPHLTESTHSQNDALSGSDSDDSRSNLQTAVVTGQRWLSPQPSVQMPSSGTAAVELWVESTTKVASVGLQGQTGSKHTTQTQLHHHKPEPALSTSMDAEQSGSPLHSCSCNSEAILALQLEVTKLKKDLQEGLVQLPHLAQKMDYLTSKCRRDREERKSNTRNRKHHRSALNRENLNRLSSTQVRIDDWISSDMDPSKSKGSDSPDTASSWIRLQFNDSPVGVRTTPEFQDEPRGAVLSCRRSVEQSSMNKSSLNEGRKGGFDSEAKHRPQTATGESFYSKERWSLFSSPYLQKPLLQVSYTSSSSLPASYKVREPSLLQPTAQHRKRSTQSDTALLPSNVFFQRTLSPLSVSPKTGSRTGRHRGSKDEDIDRTLDQAIDLARSMKRTTDRMAQRLSADLAKAQHRRKQHSLQPQGGRKHHSL